MTRLDQLRNILENQLPQQDHQDFYQYQLTAEKQQFIKDTAKSALSNVPPKPYDCALLSAVWAAMIEDHSDIPVRVFCGHLKFDDFYIFKCDGPLSGSGIDVNTSIVIKEEWDGHCWLELGGLIADLSLFRTLKYGNVKGEVKNALFKKFGENTGLLAASSELLASEGLYYEPIYVLSTAQINGIINGFINPPES